MTSHNEQVKKMPQHQPHKPAEVILLAVFLISVLFIIGTVFYTKVENLSLIDAFYLSGVTLTTLGFGDFIPTTNAGKIFTVFYALIGIGTIFYVLGKIFHIFFMKTLLDPVFHERHQLYYQQLLKKHNRKR